MGGAAAFAAFPAGAEGRRRGDPVARVRAAMGGEVLRHVRALAWSGTAAVVAGGRTLKLRVETRVEPFVRARTDSWLLDQDRDTMRTLMIEGDAGFAVVGGSQRALPVAQARHEREQYGLYGLMLFGEATAQADGRVRVVHPALRPAVFTLDAGGMPAAADYIVDSPDGSAPIAERCTFSGVVGDRGVRWPRRIAIAQGGRPFFALAIDAFHVELAAYAGG